MIKSQANQSQIIMVEEPGIGQRIDNYLFTRLKGVPKSRIYKGLRKGEIRVNKKRTKPEYRLCSGDQIRLPPLRVAEPTHKPMPSKKMAERLESSIIFEDSDFLIVNKPSGMAVHGGSGISLGVIETLRQIRPKQKFLELAHRLDRETSGTLLIAKKSSVLKEVHSLLVSREVQKTYLLLVAGRCNFQEKVIEAPLTKNILKSGERMVVVDPAGKPSKTIFSCIKQLNNMTLLEAKPITGRTHQIRVHAKYLGHPILGDEKYGDDTTNKKVKKLGFNQLCLHSYSLSFYLQSREQWIGICSVLTEPWGALIKS